MTEQDDRPDVWKMMLGSGGMYEEECLETGWIRVGFHVAEDLHRKSDNGIKRIVSAMPGLTDAQQQSRANSLIWFSNSMQKGDLVVVALKTRPGLMAIGRITGDYTYRSDIERTPHTRTVEWLKPEVPLSPDWNDVIQFIQSRRTISRIGNEETIERIEQFAVTGAALTQDMRLEGFQSEEPAGNDLSLEDIARVQIASLINERFPAKRMEHLVAGVLRAAGYTIAPPLDGADQGVDVIAGGGLLGFENPLLCVQVKHTTGRTTSETVQQLRGAVEQFGAKQGLFVSWRGYTSVALKEARQSFFRVRLWDANDLIDAICKHYSNLPDDIRKDIPLQQIWTVVPEPIDE